MAAKDKRTGGNKRKPYNKSTGRNYKKDYAKFQKSPAQKKKRATRNANRRKAEKAGRVKKGDGKDVHHKGNKTKVMSASKNRGKAGEGGRKKKK